MEMTYLSNYNFWIIVVLQIIGFVIICLKLFAKSYSSEKGKNLATKEDVGEITQIVESIKTSLTIKTEELKSDLSYKSEHLIHLRAAERAAIINYYKAMWVLVLNFTKTDFIKNEIDYFEEDEEDKDVASDLELRRYISEAESILNKIREELINLKYLMDISESELMFFYDDQELISITKELNLSLSEFERNLISSINSLLQVFKEIPAKINSGRVPNEIIVELRKKRSEILTKWAEDRKVSLYIIRIFNENLKKILHKRLKSLTF
jgi:hypothetical protein